MKISALICLACLTAMAASCTSQEAQSRSEWIAVADLDTFIEQHKPAIIDIRTPREYAGGHLAHSRNVPLDQLEQIMRHEDKDQNLLIYCNTVNRVRVAARILDSLGFKRVFIIDGGYQALMRSRYPLVR